MDDFYDYTSIARELQSPSFLDKIDQGQYLGDIYASAYGDDGALSLKLLVDWYSEGINPMIVFLIKGLNKSEEKYVLNLLKGEMEFTNDILRIPKACFDSYCLWSSFDIEC